MENDDAQLAIRRAHIGEVLERVRKHPTQLHWATGALKAEPEARHRRLRSAAKINFEDVEVFSRLLKDEFPDLVYFFANYKTDTRPPKFAADHPIALFRDLAEAVAAALAVERDKPAYNRPNFNRPDIYCRWPWPQELASGDPERLIGGRTIPDDIFRLALQYRDEGRWFSFHYDATAYVDPRVPNLRFTPSVDERSKLPAAQYPEMWLLSGVASEFFACYDLNDPETTAFARRAHALWRRIATKNVDLYDPVDRQVVDVDN